MNRRALLGIAAILCLVSGVASADTSITVAPPVVDLQVDAGEASASVAWEAMKSGKMTPEEAWQQGLLDVQALQAGLNKGLAAGEDGASKRLRLSLGDLLARHAPDVVKDALKQPKAVQLALADFYASQNDEKAAPLYEAVLKQTQASYEQGLVLCALGKFWVERKQPQKAQDVFERGRQVLTGSQRHFAAEMLVRAARAWMEDGDGEKARLLYARVAKEGDPWMTGTALMEQAAVEMHKGNSAHARQMLLQPTLITSSAVQLSILSVTGHSYYVDGEFADARKLFTQVVGQAQTIRVSSEDRVDVAVRLSGAKEHLRLIEQWTRTPLVCEPSQLSVLASSLEDEPVTRWLYVSSFRDVPVKVESNNPFITVKEGQKRWEDDEQLQYNQEFEVTVGAGARQSTDASWLSVTSARFPTVHLQIPMQFIELQGGDHIGSFPKKTP